MPNCSVATTVRASARRGVVYPGPLGAILPCLAAVWLLALSGCAGPSARNATFDRSFVFGEDTLAFRNDLVWTYRRDPATGQLVHEPRLPKPDYTHHCFVVALSARQFFQHAWFEASLPVADETTYRRLIHQVVSTSPRRLLAEPDRVVIPGYSNLFTFSRAYEPLLKAGCGSAWQSYFQRGHWRMIFPFCRVHQRQECAQLEESVARHRPAVVHLVRFPQLTINHAVVLFAAESTPDEVRFAVYDPYDPSQPSQLTFDRKTRRFRYPGNDYFEGGRVDVYEVYSAWDY